MDTHTSSSTTPSGTTPALTRIQFRLSLHHDHPTLPSRRRVRSLTALGLALVLAGTGLSACKRHHETTGEKIDHFGDKMQDTFDPPKGPAEKAGRSIDRTIHND
ncbi:hypothetical protein [Komagataeibacter oboediens]|uniref:Uncharacterized protein n=1 Tax=Komagataeibacter oboediens TaxID=65958 RepID=A0A318QS15_9PROT|nr:hypothetical protein [Komagataeibacter oboediens]GBQ07327.1 hypothetical protein AA11826_2227 [Komagataeibacter oboediens DSM 11826]MBL7232350.1 hypothetical protein [Komagataeibacter oboediens]MBT0674629.1 hypothetical protein [Komagataeibacter oboediens]MBT0677595.1 hypothetical protein [Komagataeibacter oboediens]MBV1824322.1 hypothetical protein [Komagataeibacter oboediens]